MLLLGLPLDVQRLLFNQYLCVGGTRVRIDVRRHRAYVHLCTHGYASRSATLLDWLNRQLCRGRAVLAGGEKRPSGRAHTFAQTARVPRARGAEVSSHACAAAVQSDETTVIGWCIPSRGARRSPCVTDSARKQTYSMQHSREHVLW